MITEQTHIFPKPKTWPKSKESRRKTERTNVKKKKLTNKQQATYKCVSEEPCEAKKKKKKIRTYVFGIGIWQLDTLNRNSVGCICSMGECNILQV